MSDSAPALPAASAPSKPKGRGLKALQAEIIEAKRVWKAQAKVFKTCARSKATGKGPWPIVLQRVIPRTTAAAMYDVEELKVKLCIDGKCPPSIASEEGLRVHVELSDKELPTVLARRIEGAVETYWKQAMLRKGPTGGWLLIQVLSWVESSYLSLIRLETSLIEMYTGVDVDGSSCRRFTIINPPESSSEEEELTPEQQEALRKREAELEKRQEEQQRLFEAKLREMALQKDQEARMKKERAMAGNPDDFARISKKEQQARLDAKRSKKGSRQAKRGPKARKFDAEAAAAREDPKKKKKGKKK